MQDSKLFCVWSEKKITGAKASGQTCQDVWTLKVPVEKLSAFSISTNEQI